MSKIKYILFSVICLLILTFIAVFYISNNQSWLKNTGVNLSVYKPYVLNTNINFTRRGDNSKYVTKNEGWCSQQENWRCVCGKEAYIKLYVKNGTKSAMMLHLKGFGVYNKKTDKYQKVTVFANDKEIGQLNISTYDTYSVKIPETLMTSNSLTVRFVIDKPYKETKKSKPIGLAVTDISIDKVTSNKTKIKIAKWLKNAMN